MKIVNFNFSDFLGSHIYSFFTSNSSNRPPISSSRTLNFINQSRILKSKPMKLKRHLMNLGVRIDEFEVKNYISDSINKFYISQWKLENTKCSNCDEKFPDMKLTLIRPLNRRRYTNFMTSRQAY